MNLARLLFVLACALYGSTGLAQSAEQLAAALEKHTVVLRNYYTNDSLTFDSDGQLLNAAAVLVAADHVTTLIDGVAVAAESIDSGAAGRSLDRLARVSHE